MTEEKVNNVMTWLEQLEKNGSVELPDTIQRTQNLIIEIEETIETIEVRRPTIGANEKQSVQIIEKYDAIRRWHEDDQPDNHIRLLQERIVKLESTVDQMKSKFDQMVVVYLRLRDELNAHLANLRDQSDTSMIRHQMDELAKLLNIISEKMVMPPSNKLIEANNQLEKLHQLHDELDSTKESILEATSTSRQKSQNTNISDDEAKELHKIAGSLEDRLTVANTRLVETERLQCSLRDVLKDFDKREEGLIQFIDETSKTLEAGSSAERDSLTERLEWLERIEKLLQGDKLTDLKLLQLALEKFDSILEELNAFNNNTDSEPSLRPRYENISARYNELSIECAKQSKRTKAVINALESFENDRKIAESFLAEIEAKHEEIKKDTLVPDQIVAQADLIRSFAQSVGQNKLKFTKLESVDFADLDKVEVEHLNLLATDLTARFDQLYAEISKMADKASKLSSKSVELDRVKTKIDAERGFLERSLKDVARPTQAKTSVIKERIERIQNAQNDFAKNTETERGIINQSHDDIFNKMCAQIQEEVSGSIDSCHETEQVMQNLSEKLTEFDCSYSALMSELESNTPNLDSAKSDAGDLSRKADNLRSVSGFSDLSPIDQKMSDVDQLLRKLLSDQADRLRNLKHQMEVKEQYDALYKSLKEQIESIEIPLVIEMKTISVTIQEVDDSLKQLQAIDFDQLQSLKSEIDSLEVTDFKSVAKLLSTKKQELKTARQNCAEISTKYNQWGETSRSAVESIDTLTPTSLIKTSTNVGDALRIGRDLIKNCDGLPNGVSDLNDLKQKVSALEQAFTKAQAELENQAKLDKLRDEFDAKFESCKEWIGDQMSQVAMMKTVPALEMILEPQKLQVSGIQKESEKRRPRVERLNTISSELIDEKKDDLQELEVEWDQLDKELADRQTEIELILSLLNKLNDTHQEVAKFINDTNQCISQDFTKITPTEANIATLKTKLNAKTNELASLVESSGQAFDKVTNELPDFSTNGRVKSKIAQVKDELKKVDSDLKQAASNLAQLESKVKDGNTMKDKIRDELKSTKAQPNLSKESVSQLRQKHDSFAKLVDEIAELANRPTNLRDDKRQLLADIAEIDKLVDERLRDEARRAKKTKAMNDLIADCKQQLHATKLGDTQPDSIRQKLQTVSQVLTDLSSKEAEFSHLPGAENFLIFVDEVRLRRNEFETCQEPSQHMLNDLKTFNDWYDKTIRAFESPKAFDVEKLKV